MVLLIHMKCNYCHSFEMISSSSKIHKYEFNECIDYEMYRYQLCNISGTLYNYCFKHCSAPKYVVPVPIWAKWAPLSRHAQVAWIKSDSRAILAIHTHMVAHNPRLSVTHNGHNTWKLHVTNVQPNDSGTYMCQVNTDPMRSQVSRAVEH